MAATPYSSCRLTYGITPPKLSFEEHRRRETAELQINRISELPVDALVVYDLQDESSRTDAERPFPFLSAVDPLEYAYDYLAALDLKKIVYRSVASQTEDTLTAWLKKLHANGGAAVLVGAPSAAQTVRLGLGDAYRLRQRLVPEVALGGVLIAERHETSRNEDERVLRKMDRGASFFVSQAVYSVTASKNVLSDLHYRSEAEGREMPSILVTLSPCGSKKTLQFLHWLGVSVPRWLENELMHAHDILEASVEQSMRAFEELHDFAKGLGIPLGCNVESVSLRKAEIDASVEMVHRAAKILGR